MAAALPDRSAAEQGLTARDADRRPRLSIIIEWANTRLNGVPRAWRLLDVVRVQWRQIVDRRFPASLPADAAGFLAGLAPRAEVLVVSGEVLGAALEAEIRARLGDGVDVAVHVAEGLEYYPLKNLGARRAGGDLLLFLDSDVWPDDDWLPHLVGAFARREVDVACAQTYIAPTGVFARAFALGWRYPPRDDADALRTVRTFYFNSIAFRAAAFPAAGFASLGRRSRGAGTIMRRTLAQHGTCVWQNPRASVAHPPPANLRHFVIRALAEGRDTYLARADDDARTLAGLAHSQAEALRRLGRVVHRAARHGRRVGLRAWELPVMLAICGGYYGLSALGGVLTHLSPEAMGRRFRV
ncbi:glycosyltransferase [bacterium]|nr:glycosyltransferase [bacterium]